MRCENDAYDASLLHLSGPYNTFIFGNLRSETSGLIGDLRLSPSETPDPAIFAFTRSVKLTSFDPEPSRPIRC